jgi:hypothetical protein
MEVYIFYALWYNLQTAPSREYESMKKRLSKKMNIVLCSLMVMLIILVIWIIWGNTALMVNTTTISSSRIPASFSGFRIAQVSDLHNAEFGEVMSGY